jgi:hypothetical protein
MPAPATQKLYIVKKNIRYKNPDKKLGLYRALIKPGDPRAKNGLPMPHLQPEEIKLLERRGFIAEKK